MKKLNKDKLAAWSFPILILIAVLCALLYFGGRFAFAKYSSLRANIGYTVSRDGFAYKLPCKPNGAVNTAMNGYTYDCLYNKVGYMVVGETKLKNKKYNLDPCAPKTGYTRFTPNEDWSFKRKYNGLNSTVCVHLSNSERGVNSAYRSVSAIIDSPKSIYRLEIGGPTAYSDVYSDKMEKLLSTFKLTQ